VRRAHLPQAYRNSILCCPLSSCVQLCCRFSASASCILHRYPLQHRLHLRYPPTSCVQFCCKLAPCLLRRGLHPLQGCLDLRSPTARHLLYCQCPFLAQGIQHNPIDETKRGVALLCFAFIAFPKKGGQTTKINKSFSTHLRLFVPHPQRDPVRHSESRLSLDCSHEVPRRQARACHRTAQPVLQITQDISVLERAAAVIPSSGRGAAYAQDGSTCRS
jgi:hypothetical protein